MRETPPEEFFDPDITRVKVTVNGVPKKVYSQETETLDMRNEALRHFSKNDMEGHLRSDMNVTKFYTQDKLGLSIDLPSMRDQEMDGSGLRLLNTKDGVQLEINRKTSGSGSVKSHIFIIPDAQFNIMNKVLESVVYN